MRAIRRVPGVELHARACAPHETAVNGSSQESCAQYTDSLFAVRFPIRTQSEANMRGHWTRRYKRTSEQRGIVMLILGLRRSLPLPLRVVLTRLAPRFLDSDNLAISNKAIRDQVADWLDVDDRDSRVLWEYGQEKNKTYSVRLEIFAYPHLNTRTQP